MAQAATESLPTFGAELQEHEQLIYIRENDSGRGA